MKDQNDQGFERKSLPDQIADLLRESIVAGRLTAGTRLLEIELAQRFSVSRAALRQALWTLESEGLVESRPNRGSYVAQMSERDVMEMYSLRSVLEGLAARMVAEQATPTQFAALQELVDGMIRAAKAEDHQTVDQLDLQFHRMIWAISGHRRLIQTLESMQSQIQAFLSINTGLDQERLDSILSHQGLLDTLRARDGDAADQAMRQHILFSIGGLRAHLLRMQNQGDAPA